MSPRARHLLIATLVAIGVIAYSGPSAGHNGRDAGPAKRHKPGNVGAPSGIVVTTDPKTGVRTYTQVGAVAPNPALARTSNVRGSGGPGLDYWVRQSEGEGGVYAGGGQYADNGANYDDGYAMDSGDYVDYGYGGYLPSWGYGGGGRPGHGGGDGGRPGRPGNDGGSQPPRTGGGGYNLQPGSGWSPPPGPAGGGIGSPPPRQGPGIGAPSPDAPRYTTSRGRRR